MCAAIGLQINFSINSCRHLLILYSSEEDFHLTVILCRYFLLKFRCKSMIMHILIHGSRANSENRGRKFSYIICCPYTTCLTSTCPNLFEMNILGYYRLKISHHD